MNKTVLLSLASAFSLAACGGGNRVETAAAAPAAGFAPAALVPEPPPERTVPPAQLTLAEDQRLPPPSRGRSRAAGAPAARVEAANRDATREPSRESYVNAVQVYAWSEGALYRLYTAPERVSEIALQPGEALISVAAGDTVRWVIGDTTSGSGAGRRTHILVKPSATGLRTNLVITTDRRVYHVQVESTARTAMASISWTYPNDALLAVRRGGDESGGAPAAEGVAVERLNFSYAIEGDDPPWRPVRAFDDGTQVFIEFPSSLAQGEAPPLFVQGTSGRSELVNYRLRGRYYVVDRLFAAAELRLGERRQQVVRIVRAGAARQRRRGRSS
ncbi:MAG TPA: P-type conjugative transfer protein TrbG [Allosphingosinicella sp.]|jgi:type IV secretion system protein VirB9|uniref:P-type conjugative transfer protein TrbG n=1 Tax=Allosphingosinicella sp. TaxID=2823234 RepID=UPI002F277097